MFSLFSRLILIFILSSISLFAGEVFGAISAIPWASEIQAVSIAPTSTSGTIEVQMQSVAGKVFGILKIIISGMALVYLVLVGTKMIIFSDQEDQIKTQKRQFIWTLMGFLFLNLPWFLYSLLVNQNRGDVVGMTNDWKNPESFSFINADIFGSNSLLGGVVTFLFVFIFGVAILTLTWGAVSLIISAGDDEKRKTAKNRFFYGALALVFVGFVKVWGMAVAKGNFVTGGDGLAGLAQTVFGIMLFFVAPVAVFFLIIGAYYYITSGGEEERAKKGKTIFINTAIATVLLLISVTFINDLLSFRL